MVSLTLNISYTAYKPSVNLNMTITATGWSVVVRFFMWIPSYHLCGLINDYVFAGVYRCVIMCKVVII